MMSGVIGLLVEPTLGPTVADETGIVEVVRVDDTVVFVDVDSVVVVVLVDVDSVVVVVLVDVDRVVVVAACVVDVVRGGFRIGATARKTANSTDWVLLKASSQGAGALLIDVLDAVELAPGSNVVGTGSAVFGPWSSPWDATTAPPDRSTSATAAAATTTLL
jgi:hypothetical protein